MLIDAHAHLTNAQMEEGLEAVLLRAYESGVDAIVNIATHPDELKKGLALAESHKTPRIFNVASTTPHDAEKEGELYFEEFATYAQEGKLVAIGETGLDYYYYKESAIAQQKLFRKYVKLAKELDLPIVIHCRDAFYDFFTIVEEEKVDKGVLHCFTGTLDDAKELIKREWYVSFSGIVTYKKSEELRHIAKWVPLEKMLIETDSPFLAPQSVRGKRNEPAYLTQTARVIAEIKGISYEELGKQTARNARQFFNLKLG